ncbi:MAG: FtsQ-type POTRA domain-containing protein [Clostridia bacterium]|nr:FtsQ-type POTRA domain-containing protein [Clostridia bacterium]
MADIRRRRRRRTHRRRHRESRGNNPLPLILCILLTPVAVVVAITVFFRVSTIKVTGESGYLDYNIIEASTIDIGQNMFMFNKFKVIDGIFEQMPYLDEISIRRRLPDTVEIIVSRCTPVAAIEGADGWYLLDAKGKLLENVGAVQPAEYPVIVGAEMDEPTVGKYIKIITEEKQKPLFLVLNTAINNDILQYIGCIDVERAYNIKFTYKDRFTVNIGDIEQIEKKFRYMLLLAEDKLPDTAVGTIDVSDGTVARFIPTQQ